MTYRTLGRTPEFSLALTHVFKGVARFTRVGPRTRTALRRDDPNTPKLDDSRRRAQILQQLYGAYALEVMGAGGEPAWAETLPPDGWVNDRLTAMGERWRVQNVDGFRCEIYEAMA